MSILKNRLDALLVALGLCLFLGGCVNKPAPTTVYVLDPLPVAATQTVPSLATTDMIMVLPVRLPPLLRQQSIVVDEGDGIPRALVGHFWAGPLAEQIGANLVANLQTLLNSPNVTLYPGPRYATPRLQVETEIIRFGGDLQHFTLRAITTISDTQKRRILSRKTFDKTAELRAANYPAYAKAASETLAALAAELAATLTTLIPPESAETAR